MSLISESRDGNSPLGSFLRKNLNPKEVIREINQKLKANLVVGSRLKGHRSALLGTAIDYRLRFYFKEEPFFNLLAWRGLFKNTAIIEESVWYKIGNGFLEYFVKFNNDFSRLTPTNRRLSPKQEDLLCRHCFVLAKLEQLYRTAGHPISIWSNSKDDFKFYSEFSGSTSADFHFKQKKILSSFSKQEINEAKKMSWLFYKSKIKWIKSKKIFMNPIFSLSPVIGGADGDIIINHTYYDIKSTAVGVRNSDIFQLLAYPLLDKEKQYEIENTGIYLARTGLSIEWKLETLYKKMAKTNHSFYRFKCDFYRIMNTYYKRMLKNSV